MSNKDPLSDLRKLDLPFDVDEVIPECHECVRKQLKRYKHYVYPDGRRSESFEVDCKGIKKQIISPQLIHKYTPEELFQIKGMLDPVYFAENFMIYPDGGQNPIILRDYQAIALRCTSPRRVLRWSRRVGKTMSVCVDIIHKLLTQHKVRLILAAPMIEQVENIFVRVRDFFFASPALKSSIANFKRSPHELTLKNESILKGFAAGSVSRGGDGTSIRGQDADIIYLEEADYVSEEAITGAILPLLSTSPNTKIVAFSTPLGFTTTPFYKLCYKSPDYKEFHFTYRVLPWAKEIEKQRHNMTEEKWNHEYEALFTESSSGVYKPKYIDKAITKYDYTDQQRIPYWSYCMGVDWNEKHGAEIVVLGYDPHTKKFKIAEAIHVGGSSFTQLNSVAKVIEMHKKWKPDYIYVDSGNGSTNYELLLHNAKKAIPGDDIYNFIYMLKKYDSGSKIEVRDIVTGEKVRKAAKPFMVDASIRMFEQNRISIPDSDTLLEKQLRNYIIDRYTETNIPKFGLLDSAVGDHRLDALNLAVVAFQLEFADLFKREYFTSISIANNPLKSKEEEIDDEDSSREIVIAKRGRNSSTTQRLLHSKYDNNSRSLLRKKDMGWGEEKQNLGRSGVLKNSKSRSSRDKPSRSNF